MSQVPLKTVGKFCMPFKQNIKYIEPKIYTLLKMKVCSWNVNGYRSCIKTGAFSDMILATQADFYCIQEMKINKNVVYEDYLFYGSWAEKKRL